MLRDDLQKFDLPDAPGVYTFRDSGRKILYIGKATSLRDRVRSYFASDIVDTRGKRIEAMVALAATITWEETDSVLEALILEANEIKKHHPPYNVDEKDNKSFNYLVITKEDFPRVIVVRGREVFQSWQEQDMAHLFGPFPYGAQLKEAVKLVRSIFPFRDKCTPCGQSEKFSEKRLRQGAEKADEETYATYDDESAEAPERPSVNEGSTEASRPNVRGNGRSFGKLSCKPCFDAQLSQCPGVCSGKVSEAEYAKTIRNIVLLFSGKKKSLLETLERDMRAYARTEQFEEAATVRKQIAALTHIRDVALIKASSRISSGGAGVRIEGFDIAHTAGSDTVGIMVVIMDGEVSKSDVRKFRVRSVTNNDPAALAEIVSRRLGHPEWPLPRLFVIDGAKAQVGAVERVLAASGVQIPVVGVVKDEKHRPRSFIGESTVIKSYQREILLADDEAHKQVIGYHRAKQRKRVIPQ